MKDRRTGIVRLEKREVIHPDPIPERPQDTAQGISTGSDSDGELDFSVAARGRGKKRKRHSTMGERRHGSEKLGSTNIEERHLFQNGSKRIAIISDVRPIGRLACALWFLK